MVKITFIQRSEPLEPKIFTLAITTWLFRTCETHFNALYHLNALHVFRSHFFSCRLWTALHFWVI